MTLLMGGWPMTTTDRATLLAALQANVLTEGEFRLHSGSSSGIFVDVQAATSQREPYLAMGRMVAHVAHELNCTILGGPAIGGLQVALSALAVPDVKLRSFYTRGPEMHGGRPRPGEAVLIVDDVATTGYSLYECAWSAYRHGARIACFLTIVDRMLEHDPEPLGRLAP